MMPLGDLCQIKTGKKDVNQGNPDGIFPFFTCAKEHTFSDGYSFEGDAILVAGNGDVGNVQRYSGKFEAYQRTYVLMDFEKILPQYLFHVLQGKLKSALTDQKLGNTMPYIKKDMLTNFEIPLPPLDEQLRIVAMLGKAFASIDTATANAQKNLTNARALFKSYLHANFSERCKGWTFVPFEECLQKIKYTAKIQRKDFKRTGSFPIVSQEADFINGYWDNDEDVLRVKSPIVIFGDHTQVLKYVDFDFVLGADGVKLLLPKPAISAKFLFYFLKANPINSIGYARHYRLLKELNVGFPAVPEQVKITERLDEFSQQIAQLEEVYEAKVLALTELKQALLQKAFAGELT